MFDLNELREAIPEINESLLDLMDVVRFDQNCFASSSSEEAIIACRGSKKYFKTAASFWLHSLRADDWSGRENYFAPYVDLGLFIPIGSDQFYATIKERTQRLARNVPDFLRDSRSLIGAQKMYDDWDDVAVIAERDQDFITFHWETSA